MSQLAKIAPMVCLLGAFAAGQTTQALISGRLQDSITGQPIAHALISFEALNENTAGAAESDDLGFYYLPLLSPGFYHLRFTAERYQSQELYEIELPVAARMELDLRMRILSDVWEAGQFHSVFLPGVKTIVTFYGPDVDPSLSGSFDASKGRLSPLESTVSQVIDSDELLNLPLQGRDVYDMLVTQQGVTADQGTARGLGLSINGQRPTASNFLLDGLENNNYLITGPLTTLAPELIQEYRVSINNFSAEYGRTGGFVANAITYAGSEQFHGTVYFYLRNDALNANDFQRNLIGLPTQPLKEIQPGFRLTGPILHNRLLFSGAFERLRDRSRLDPATYLFPTPAYIQGLPAQSAARQLLTTFAPPQVQNGARNNAPLVMSPTASIDRSTAIGRLDYRHAHDDLTASGSMVLLSRPDFVWSPYPAFTSALKQNTLAGAVSDLHTFHPGLVNDARMGYNNDYLSFGRNNPQVPTLISSDATALPGAPFFYPYENRNGTWQFLDNVIRSRGRHLITVGGGLLLRSSNGIFAPGRDGEYFFSSLTTLAQDRPSLFEAAVDRAALPITRAPDTQREYRYRQYFFFLQDTFKVTRRVTLNYGLRYENYGSPENTGAVKDAVIQLGQGTGFPQELATAKFVFPGSGDQKLFQTDNHDWAPRVGASWDVWGNGRTLLRGSSGLFYDRPFDNLWQEVRVNNQTLSLFRLTATSTNFLAAVPSVLPGYSNLYSPTAPPNPTLFQDNLPNARVISSFVGVDQRLTSNLSLEVNGLLTLGRHLITTDVINRFGGLYQPITNTVPVNINYRGTQGSSNYDALTTVLRYRVSRAEFRVSYTWSHSIDNQSDPLRQDLLDFGFTSGSAASTIPASGAGFSTQFDSNSDRGSSDFDQRQNLVYYSTWSMPALAQGTVVAPLLRNWRLAAMGALRSDFPFSVYGVFGRASIVDPTAVELSSPTPVAGGELLLNKNAFGPALSSTPGNSGRNAFRGPGLSSLDVSLARTFAAGWLGEAGRLEIRADAYNVLNHANLNNPFPNLALANFGQATFGRDGVQSGFPSLSPLNETARNIQIVLRVSF
jgi:hypothetical protein